MFQKACELDQIDGTASFVGSVAFYAFTKDMGIHPFTPLYKYEGLMIYTGWTLLLLVAFPYVPKKLISYLVRIYKFRFYGLVYH